MYVEAVNRPTQPEPHPELAVEDFLSGVAPYGTIQAYDHFYAPVPKDLKVITGCIDGRGPTAESARYMNDHYRGTLDVSEGYARMPGGRHGIALIIRGAIATAHGEEGLARALGLHDTVGLVATTSEGRIVSHSAEKNEGHRTQLQPESTNDLGCAFAMLAGAAVHLIAKPGLVRDVATAEIQHAMPGYDYATLADGFGHLSAELSRKTTTGDAADFSISRSDMIADHSHNGVPMILDGIHAEGHALHNFGTTSRTVSNPTAASRANMQFLSTDPVMAGEEIGRAPYLSDLLHWPDYIAGTMAASVVVRSVLAPDGDPRSIPVGIIGDPWNAVDYLEDTYRR